MRRFYLILMVVMFACLGCEWHLRPSDNHDGDKVSIARYDRIELLYLTTADFAVLQQMKIEYPVQTRTLIEDVLKLGSVDTLDINTKFLVFFQDSTLQMLLSEVERQYADVSDLEQQLTKAFARLVEMDPELEVPVVYAQVGSLDQSIVAGNGMLGISLDKYLGSDYPLYQRYGYTERQRQVMTRENIVPDCLRFYLLSVYAKHQLPEASPDERDQLMGHIKEMVNEAMR